MKPDDFDLFATLVKQRSGLVLTGDQSYLLESRLLPVTRTYNLKSLEDMAQAVRSTRDEKLMHDITEAMTIHDSYFLRDLKPFRYFQSTLLPQLLVKREAKKHLRIWSAACSSGQEAYSLAMICAGESDKLQGWKVDIIGTDLSREIIARAKSGIFTPFEVQRGLPVGMLIKYFEQSGDKWQIKDEIRQRVQFSEGNLLHDFGPIGVFDVVFCRNVLHCFDPLTKTKVLESISHVMLPDGMLFLSLGETTTGLPDHFKSIHAPCSVFGLESAAKAQ
jgi:chemotaxis protein methyltransferase CheR